MVENFPHNCYPSYILLLSWCFNLVGKMQFCKDRLKQKSTVERGLWTKTAGIVSSQSNVANGWKSSPKIPLHTQTDTSQGRRKHVKRIAIY